MGVYVPIFCQPTSKKNKKQTLHHSVNSISLLNKKQIFAYKPQHRATHMQNTRTLARALSSKLLLPACWIKCELLWNYLSPPGGAQRNADGVFGFRVRALLIAHAVSGARGAPVRFRALPGTARRQKVQKGAKKEYLKKKKESEDSGVKMKRENKSTPFGLF